MTAIDDDRKVNNKFVREKVTPQYGSNRVGGLAMMQDRINDSRVRAEVSGSEGV